MDRRTLWKDFSRALTGASLASLDLAARTLDVGFPPDYAAFMGESNGGEGFVGEEYLVLWPVEQLASANDEGKTGQFFPSWVFIGSNGAGEAVALKRGDEATVALVPFIGREDDALPGGHSLDEFIASYTTGAIWRARRTSG